MGYDTSIAKRSGRSIAVDNAPNRGWSRWIRRAPQPTSLSLSHYSYDYDYDEDDPKRIEYDDSVTLTATISTSLYDDDIEHVTLSLYQRPRGARRWRLVTREKTRLLRQHQPHVEGRPPPPVPGSVRRQPRLAAEPVPSQVAVRPRWSADHEYRVVTAGDGPRRTGYGNDFMVRVYDAKIRARDVRP